MPTVAYRAVRERRKFVKAPEIKAALGVTLDTVVKRRFLIRFRRVVGNWNHKPAFQARKFITTEYLKVNVFPAGPNKQIYKWVTDGTKGPYKIPKAGPGYLAFVWGGPGSYKPKTKPVGQYGGMGVATGTLRRGIMQVTHPGITPREFEKAIKDDEKEWVSRTMELAWRRAIRSV